MKRNKNRLHNRIIDFIINLFKDCKLEKEDRTDIYYEDVKKNKK